MKLKPLLLELFEENDYRGQHTAPTKEDAPLYDLTTNGIYPDDVYSSKAVHYYGTSIADSETYSIISSCKGKPNAIVTMYRAMPNKLADSEAKIKDINTLIRYVESFGFAPLSTKKIKTYAAGNYFNTMRDKFGYMSKFTDKDKYLDYLYNERKKIKDGQTEKSTINPGDWVTLTKAYAKEHMNNVAWNGGWKIVSKKVKAKELFTDGNSWDEWGWNP